MFHCAHGKRVLPRALPPSAYALDTSGKQVDGLSGEFPDVREKILAAAGPATRFHVGTWGAGDRWWKR